MAAGIHRVHAWNLVFGNIVSQAGMFEDRSPLGVSLYPPLSISRQRRRTDKRRRGRNKRKQIFLNENQHMTAFLQASLINNTPHGPTEDCKVKRGRGPSEQLRGLKRCLSANQKKCAGPLNWSTPRIFSSVSARDPIVGISNLRCCFWPDTESYNFERLPTLLLYSPHRLLRQLHTNNNKPAKKFVLFLEGCLTKSVMMKTIACCFWIKILWIRLMANCKYLIIVTHLSILKTTEYAGIIIIRVVVKKRAWSPIHSAHDNHASKGLNFLSAFPLDWRF